MAALKCETTEDQRRFVVLENQSGEDFSHEDFIPRTVEASYQGAWILMEVFDFDKDGDPDIVLGAAYPPYLKNSVHPKYRKAKMPSVLILENKIR